MTNIKKTVYLCPAEGVVSQSEDHLFVYDLSVIDDDIHIHITNKGFLCIGTEYSCIKTTKQELISIVQADEELKERLNGDINELVEEMPDEFVETMCYIYDHGKRESIETKDYIVFEIHMGIRYGFNETKGTFVEEDFTKYCKKDAITKQQSILTPRIEKYQSTGKNYIEVWVSKG